jgi:hypothetical protein
VRPLTEASLCVYIHMACVYVYTRLPYVCVHTYIQTYRLTISLTRERMRTPEHGNSVLLFLSISLFMCLTRDLSTGFHFDLVDFDAFLPDYQARHLCVYTDRHTFAHIPIVTRMHIYISPTFAQYIQ